MTSANIRPGIAGQRQTLVCEHNVAGHVDKVLEAVRALNDGSG